MRKRNQLIILALSLLLININLVVLNGLFINGGFKKKNINNNEGIQVSRTQEKIIYLTFDDGPTTKVSTKILDVLNEEGVKATFFIVGNKIEGREDILKRMYNEGHGIGLHSYTHKYEKIYSNENVFIEEMKKTSDEIERVIGIRSNIIRFPWGSQGRINKAFLDKLHDLGYRIYDWTVQTTDGLNPKTSVTTIIKQGTKLPRDKDSIILLLHCDVLNKNTCDSLPNIIKFYRENNYEFRIITDETPECIIGKVR